MDHFGLLNIAKPAGMTSRDVVDWVQRLVRPAKAGHAGTLDPLATGVLIVCVGRATRLVPLIQEMRKTYRATFLLGRTSDSDDVEGTIIETPDVSPPTREQVQAVLPEFVGRIHQRPPAYSAVKVAGRRAYALARKGQAVDLAIRPVDVYRLDLLRYEYPELELEIECGSGTYVRSIGRDLGERLGCGAVMSALQRTAIGPFMLDSAAHIEDVTAESLPQLLLPPTAATVNLPQASVNPADVRAMTNGRSVPLSGVGIEGSPVAESSAVLVAVLDDAGALVALAEIVNDQLLPRQVFAERM